MTRRDMNIDFHRPIRGGRDLAIATGGGIRELICPRLMSIVLSGRSGSCAFPALEGHRTLARCKRARERGTWNRAQNNVRPEGVLDS